MNEDLIADLKQFIMTTVSQAATELRQSLESKMDQMSSHVSLRLDDLEAKLDTVADAHSEILEEHEGRLRRVEQGA